MSIPSFVNPTPRHSSDSMRISTVTKGTGTEDAEKPGHPSRKKVEVLSKHRGLVSSSLLHKAGTSGDFEDVDLEAGRTKPRKLRVPGQLDEDAFADIDALRQEEQDRLDQAVNTQLTALQAARTAPNPTG